MTEQAKGAPSGANAPYKIKKQGGKWCVVNNIGETKASFPGNDAGYQRALAYQRALYVNVPGAAKRADKVKFTGKARQRIPKEKSMDDLRERMQAAYGTAGMEGHDFVRGAEGNCMICGKPSVNPAHDKPAIPNDDWDEGQQDAITELTTAAYTGGGCMVALYVDPETAGKLHKQVGEGAEKPDEMHITLAYMKDSPASTDAVDKLKAIVEHVADSHPPLDGRWGGTGKFNPSPGSDGRPVTVALPDLPGLPALRHDLVAALDAAGFTVSKDHGYTPHTTLKYGDSEPGKEPKVTGKLDFDAISLSVGSKRWDFPLHTSSVEAAKEFTDDKRDKLADKGHALPDGSFPIENVQDLKNAIAAVGRAKNPAAARRHIKKRARALGHPELIPESWSSEKAHDSKQKKHRFVAAHHLRDHVVSHVGYFGGCYACGKPESDPDHDGDVDQPGVPDSDSSAGSAPVQAAEVADLNVNDTIAALDAVIDQIMVLMRSTPTEDLPPYAAQAKDLLGAADLALDGLMESLGIPDPDDDDGPDKNDAGPEAAKLSEADEAELQAESEHIKVNKEKPAAKAPHEFRPARFTHPNGHPRCLMCGQEEPLDDVCNNPHPPDPQVVLQQNPSALGEVASTSVQERQATVEDAPALLPATRAFLSEINGHTLLTAPASTFEAQWEKALSPNKHFLWMQGRFVGAEKANRNGAFWSNADLEMGEPTVKHGPLNWLHEDRHVIGTIADAKLVAPTSEQAAEGEGSHIAAVAAIWRWIYPDEAFVVEQASDQGKLWYSMECISREVACEGPNGCGKVVPYASMMRNTADLCDHVRQRASTRHFIDPTFLGGAVIVPPVRPGWGEADARVMREAAALAERAFDQAGRPDIAASEWELLMASVVAYAER